MASTRRGRIRTSALAALASVAMVVSVLTPTIASAELGSVAATGGQPRTDVPTQLQPESRTYAVILTNGTSSDPVTFGLSMSSAGCPIQSSTGFTGEIDNAPYVQVGPGQQTVVTLTYRSTREQPGACVAPGCSIRTGYHPTFLAEFAAGNVSIDANTQVEPLLMGPVLAGCALDSVRPLTDPERLPSPSSVPANVQQSLGKLAKYPCALTESDTKASEYAQAIGSAFISCRWINNSEHILPTQVPWFDAYQSILTKPKSSPLAPWNGTSFNLFHANGPAFYADLQKNYFDDYGLFGPCLDFGDCELPCPASSGMTGNCVVDAGAQSQSPCTTELVGDSVYGCVFYSLDSTAGAPPANATSTSTRSDVRAPSGKRWRRAFSHPLRAQNPRWTFDKATKRIRITQRLGHGGIRKAVRTRSASNRLQLMIQNPKKPAAVVGSWMRVSKKAGSRTSTLRFTLSRAATRKICRTARHGTAEVRMTRQQVSVTRLGDIAQAVPYTLRIRSCPRT